MSGFYQKNQKNSCFFCFLDKIEEGANNADTELDGFKLNGHNRS